MSDTPERDPLEEVEKAFDDFADATENTLKRFADDVRAVRAEIASLREEQRSVQVLATQMSIDESAIATRVAALVPPPSNGKDGENGKDAVVDYDKITEQVRATLPAIVATEVGKVPLPTVDTDAIVTRAAAHIPIPRDGRDGKDAVVNIEEIITRVAELAIPRITAAIPTPKDGEKGDPGKDGERGDDGLNAPEEIRSIAREEVMTQQRDFYKGVFVDGNEYRTADAVTWDGSLWFAMRDTGLKPGNGNADWKMAVKKGRDGKDAKR